MSKQNLGCVSAAAAEAQAKEARRDLLERIIPATVDPVALMDAVRECVAAKRAYDTATHERTEIGKWAALPETSNGLHAALRRLGEVCDGK